MVNNNFILNNQNNKKICCTCVKTECIKKYCACYASGHFCEGCECKNCLNTLEAFQKSHSNININIIKNNNNNGDNIVSSNIYNSLCEENKMNNNEYNPLDYNNSNHNMSTIIINNNINPFNQNHLHTEVICNCTKSNCTKKYCECFKMGRRCDALCRCVNCLNKVGNSAENNNNEKQLQTIENFYDNNYLKNNHINEISKQNENTYNTNKKIDCQTEQFLTNTQLTANNNVVNHLNRNIQSDNIRNKARKLCLSFKTDCIGIEINRKGIKIDKRNLLFEDSEQKDKPKGKVKDKSIHVVKNNGINSNNINKDIKSKSNNIMLKVKNENIGNNDKMIEEIQTTPKMTKRKRSRNKNESTSMKTPSNTSTGKQRANKRKLNLRDHRVTKKKLIL